MAAIGQLRTLLVGDDVELAAGALALLQAMSSDDSMSVRAAALDSLAAAQLRPVPMVVELGEQTEQVVALTGAPLARIFHVSTETRWSIPPPIPKATATSR